jgi:4-hydroxythreonine-4-phosphate dehydrogenase
MKNKKKYKAETPDLSKPLITLGSPYGVGYEIFLRSLKKKTFSGKCPVCIGSSRVIDAFQKMLGTKKKYHKVYPSNVGDLAGFKIKGYDFILIDIDNSNIKFKDISSISRELDGTVAFKSIYIAAELINKNYFKSICTLPVSKENVNIIEPTFNGHTGFFQEKWNEKSVFMTFVSKKLALLLMTTHIPLSEVPNALDHKLVRKALETALKLKKRLNIKKRICVLGLNPHAGEHGLIGKEDLWIKKEIDDFNNRNATDVIGPVPADTAFLDFSLKKFGLYIACYHDQGLIPFKVLSFESGVNLSFGMKHIRTSVDHGTAIDLIGKKKASTKSFINAYKLASRLAR